MTQKNWPPSSEKSVFGKRASKDDVAGSAQCPSCDQSVRYRYRHIGHRVRCKSCQAQILIGTSLRDKAPQRVEIPPSADYRIMVMPQRRLPVARLGVTAALVTAALGGAFWISRGSIMGDEIGDAEPLAIENADSQGFRDVDGDAAITPPEITLAQIQALREANDRHQALITGRVWRQMLSDFEVDDSDERLPLLDQIISELEEELRPPPVGLPPFIQDFRKAITDLREAIQSRDIDAGRTALALAEQLLGEYPDELSPYGRSLLSLKFRLNQLIQELEGRDNIEQLLTDAEEFLRQEKPTEAADAIAMAKFLALRTPMSDAEFAERDAQVEQLERELKFLRGKKSVEAAAECHRLNDLEARDLQLGRAFEFLPEFESDRVTSLLIQARNLAEQEIRSPTTTEFGHSLSFLMQYEAALEYFGRIGTLEVLINELIEADQLLTFAPSRNDQFAPRIADMALQALEFEIGFLLQDRSNSDTIAFSLAEGRTALNAAERWKDNARWRVLDESLATRGDELARMMIDEALILASNGDLEQAVRSIDSAITLGKSDTRQTALGHRQQWQAELDQIALLRMESETWDRINSLVAGDQVFEAWTETKEFIANYPDSERLADVQEAQESLVPRMRQKLAEELDLIEDLLAEGEWEEFRLKVEAISEIPIGGFEARIAGLNAELDEFPARGQQLYRSVLQFRTTYKGSVDQMIELLDVLGQVIVLNPENEEARSWLAEVRERAERRATNYWIRAMGTQRTTTKIEYLQRYLDLSPNGDMASEAREQLDQLLSED